MARDSTRALGSSIDHPLMYQSISYSKYKFHLQISKDNTDVALTAPELAYMSIPIPSPTSLTLHTTAQVTGTAFEPNVYRATGPCSLSRP